VNAYILDTDTCIYWLNGIENIRQHVQQCGPRNLRVTIVTFAELRYGAYNSHKVEENLRKIDQFLKKVKVLPLDREAADRFGRFKTELRRQGKNIGDLDLLIASIAIRFGGTLITNNVEHFQRVPGLHYENWLA
jgi:tRNA(fMet)-specific endonuclease VapC